MRSIIIHNTYSVNKISEWREISLEQHLVQIQRNLAAKKCIGNARNNIYLFIYCFSRAFVSFRGDTWSFQFEPKIWLKLSLLSYIFVFWSEIKNCKKASNYLLLTLSFVRVSGGFIYCLSLISYFACGWQNVTLTRFSIEREILSDNLHASNKKTMSSPFII